MNPVKEMTREELKTEVNMLRKRCDNLEKAYMILAELFRKSLGEEKYQIVVPYIANILAQASGDSML